MRRLYLTKKGRKDKEIKGEKIKRLMKTYKRKEKMEKSS